MKKTVIVLVLFLTFYSSFAQSQSTEISTKPVINLTLPALDKSPMDMAYFPADYPIQKTQNRISAIPMIRVIYSRPQKENRVIFGELIEYNKVWRLGANEATEIEFFKEAAINGKKIAKGRYTLYAIPNATKWTIIINKDTDSWGAFIYDQKKDVIRIDVPVTNLATPVETFSLQFTKALKGAALTIAWDTSSVNLPIEIK